MITIKDLKKEDILQNDNCFRKVISIINEDLVVLSQSWHNNSVKEHITEISQEIAVICSNYELKDYTLVKKDWSWRDLKVGDEYWNFNEDGTYADIWENDKYDMFRVKSGIIYQTEKDAKEAYELIMSKE